MYMLGWKLGDLAKGCFRDFCRDDVLLQANPEISLRIYQTKLWIIAEKKLCGRHKFMVRTHFVQHDNLTQVKR